MHRRFGDRMLSMFNPVRRYGCTNHLCAHEAILRKSSTLTQRPIVAVAGLIGAALTGAVVTGLGLYATSDATTRAAVWDAFMSFLQGDAGDRSDGALPVSRLGSEPEDETAIPESSSDTGDLKAELMPPVPTLSPFANPSVSPRQPR
jgi:hypothetical protein